MSYPPMAVQALAGEIVEALLADEKDGGYDLEAGMFGPAFSTLVRRWVAAEWQIAAPIDMVLYCPNCGVQHIDAATDRCSHDACPRAECCAPGDCLEPWTNPPHRSHLCHACGCIWRPADVPTNGVDAIKTEGKADSWSGKKVPPAVKPHLVTMASIMEDQKRSDMNLARSMLHTQIRNAITDIQDGDEEGAIETLKQLVGDE